MVQLQYDVITKKMLANVFTSTMLHLQGKKKKKKGGYQGSGLHN